MTRFHLTSTWKQFRRFSVAKIGDFGRNKWLLGKGSAMQISQNIHLKIQDFC